MSEKVHEYFQGSLCSPATARAVEHVKMLSCTIFLLQNSVLILSQTLKSYSKIPLQNSTSHSLILLQNSALNSNPKTQNPTLKFCTPLCNLTPKFHAKFCPRTLISHSKIPFSYTKSVLTFPTTFISILACSS